MSGSSIYMHYHPDEHPFVDKALDWVEKAAMLHQQRLTDFLDPRQAAILEALVNQHTDVHFRLDGGYVNAERRRALIAPDYRDLSGEEMNIRLLSITPEADKLEKLTHGDVLGALLGLGIKRDKIGDIHLSDDHCHCLIAGEMADYIDIHLRQVHRLKVHTSLLPLEQLLEVVPSFDDMTFTAASMRLDGIVSDLLRVSRTKAVEPIKSGRCRVNWRVVEDPSSIVRQGDVISLQGFGRFKLLEVGGETKKGRIRIRAGKYQ